nr:immunoglobulin light chain junction region [Macaca mulatta]
DYYCAIWHNSAWIF